VFSRQGFVTRRHSAVVVALGATTTADAVMVAGLAQDVTVLGAPPLLDRNSAPLRFASTGRNWRTFPVLATWVLSSRRRRPCSWHGSTSAQRRSDQPSVQCVRDDGGAADARGNLHWTDQSLRADAGLWIVQEVSVASAASGPEQLTSGLRVQFITKSSGDRYHGSFYADYGNRHWPPPTTHRWGATSAEAAGSTTARSKPCVLAARTGLGSGGRSLLRPSADGCRLLFILVSMSSVRSTPVDAPLGER